jgi:hypothetical protein
MRTRCLSDALANLHHHMLVAELLHLIDILVRFDEVALRRLALRLHDFPLPLEDERHVSVHETFGSREIYQRTAQTSGETFVARRCSPFMRRASAPFPSRR